MMGRLFEEAFIMQFLLMWLISFLIISVTDGVARRKLGVKSEGWQYLRASKRFAFLMLSLPVFFLLGCTMFGKFAAFVSSSWAKFIAVPFFCAVAYFPMTVFRELKIHRQGGRIRL